ncbi:hypothetical protein KZP23_11730 [Echinicola marina]|uniref:hypothetical protein n=1 Tax=Echinicola marina TaxID=2859768 RepID=UPI001CF6DDD5|nr:hypothetical protein [Echinicola marina]UCS95631.1 hypothetical protein KZP23_11730 [Echinicola marina]
MPDQNSRMMQAIYDTLFSAYTNPPEGTQGPATSQADQTYLSLNWPGQQIDISQFANPFSPNNPDGSMEAVENFSTLVDNLFSINPITSQNGNRLSLVYKSTVNAQVVPPPEDPKAKEAYEKAFDFLHTNGVTYNDEGKPVTVKVDSPIYSNYKRKLKAYNDAVVSLMSNYFQYDMSKPADQRKWSLLGPTFQSAVKMAYEDLINAQKTKVEDMLAVLSQSSNNQVGVAFKQARETFDSYQRAGLSDPNKVWYPTYALPANWFAPGAAEEWTEVTINSKEIHTSEHSDFSKISAGGKASWGLWNVGGSFDKEDSHQSMSSDTKNLKVSFKFCRIMIDRPWYNNLLYSMKGWNLGEQYGPGELSNGTRVQELNMPFPLLPTSFIAVRDLKISADFSHEDSSLIESKLSTSASFGWGPFSISGSYATGSTDKKFNSKFDGSTISNDGLQIIGWVNNIVPFAPPKPSSVNKEEKASSSILEK